MNFDLDDIHERPSTMTPHPHKAHLTRLAEDTSLQVWMWQPTAKCWTEMHQTALLNVAFQDRIFALGPKPTAPPDKRCTLGGLSFPEPLKEAPGDGYEYWLVGRTTAGPTPYTWYDGAADRAWLAANLIQLTELGAREQSAAMAAALQGAVEEAR